MPTCELRPAIDTPRVSGPIWGEDLTAHYCLLSIKLFQTVRPHELTFERQADVFTLEIHRSLSVRKVNYPRERQDHLGDCGKDPVG